MLRPNASAALRRQRTRSQDGPNLEVRLRFAERPSPLERVPRRPRRPGPDRVALDGSIRAFDGGRHV